MTEDALDQMKCILRQLISYDPNAKSTRRTADARGRCGRRRVKNCCGSSRIDENNAIADLSYDDDEENEDEEDDEDDEDENDQSTMAVSFNCYNILKQFFDIEDNKSEWIFCLFYLAHKNHPAIKRIAAASKPKETTPTSTSGEDLDRTRAFFKKLVFSNLTISGIVNKINKIVQISNWTTEIPVTESAATTTTTTCLLDYGQLESKNNVLRCIYAKYRHIFESIFTYLGTCQLVLVSIDARMTRSRAHRSSATVLKFFLRLDHSRCDLADLFELCWRLFILVKEQYPQISSDLVGLYHLMLCAFNFVLVNLLLDDRNRTVLLKPAAASGVDVFDVLCQTYDGETLRAKTINEHYFKPTLCGLYFESSEFKLDNIKKLIDTLRRIKKNEKDEGLFDVDVNNLLDRFASDRRSKCDDSMTCIGGQVEAEEIIDTHVVWQCPSSIYRAINRGVESSLVDGENESISEELVNFVQHECEKQFQDAFRKCLFDLETLKIDQLEANLRKLEKLVLETTRLLFFSSMNQIVETEWKNKSNESSDNLISSIKESKPGRAFSKAIYLCCLEIVLNFCQISVDNSKTNKFSSKIRSQMSIVAYISLISPSSSIQYPWGGNALSIEPFDFVCSIESFIRSTGSLNEVYAGTTKVVNGTTPTSLTTSATNETSVFCLDRKMVEHLAACEEKALEWLVWDEQSEIWKRLGELQINAINLLCVKFNEKSPTSPSSNRRLLFPLYEDLFNNLNQQPIFTPDGPVASNGGATKQNQIITRVVCSQTPSNIVNSNTSNNSNESSKRIQILTLSNSKNLPINTTRLTNLNFPLHLFFRKFYALASARLKTIITKLDLTSAYVKVMQQQRQTDNNSTTMTKCCSSPCCRCLPVPAANAANKLLTADVAFQILFKKIWLVFEHAIGVESNKNNHSESLLKNAHLDQILICCVYIVSRLNSLNLTMRDILSTYRTCMSPEKFAQVLVVRGSRASASVDDQDDLISFYNKTFVSKLKKVAFEINNDNVKNQQQQQQQQLQSTPLTVSNSSQFITPVNGSTTINSGLPFFLSTRSSPANSKNSPLLAPVEFSPRRAGGSVFVSPSKLTNSTAKITMAANISNNQPAFIKPTSVDRFQVSLEETCLLKNVRAINKRIQKGELKIKCAEKCFPREINNCKFTSPGLSSSTSKTNSNATSTTIATTTASNPTVYVSPKSESRAKTASGRLFAPSLPSSSSLKSAINLDFSSHSSSSHTYIHLGANFSKRLKTALDEKN